MRYNYFKLHTNCILTEGFNRVLITDLQRFKSIILPKDFYLIFKENFEKKININEVLKKKYNENLIEYFDYLVENDFGLYLNKINVKSFPKINLSYEKPNFIENCIIEIDVFNNFLFKDSIKFITDLKCNFLTIFIYSKITLENLSEINQVVLNSGLKSFEIYINGSDSAFNKKLVTFFNKNQSLLTNLIFYSSLEDNVQEGFYNITKIKDDLKSFKKCGIVNTEGFNSHKDHFLESLNHNSCLHKKISIDKDGNIKNCPAMTQSFGNIKNISLEEALNHPDFKKYWNVTKDIVEVCKDCEFRHICTDCRAYTERNHFDGEIDLSKPLKCGYNPYTNEWSEWSTNPLKEKAIEYYGMQDLVKTE